MGNGDFFILILMGLYFLLGVCITAIINHFLAKDRDRQIRVFIDFNAAARELREAFLDIRILLEVKPPIDPAIGNEWQKTIKILRRFYPQHRAAVRKFEEALPAQKKTPFRESWREYCCYDTQNNPETFFYYYY